MTGKFPATWLLQPESAVRGGFEIGEASPPVVRLRPVLALYETR